MCQSKAQGGRRCFNAAKHGTAEQWKERRAKAKKQNDMAEIKRCELEYLTTEEGIEVLEGKGEFEKAAKLRTRRNRLIDEYNREYKAKMPHFGTYEERKARKAAIANKPVWSKAGINKFTNTKFSPQGWSKDGINEHTHTKWDEDGYDVHGYGQDGYHKESGRNRAGYDCEGYDENLRDVKGFHKITGRNKQGLDRDGWNEEGWNLLGTVHRDTGGNLNPETFDVNDWSPVHKMFRAEWKALQASKVEPAYV